METGKRNGYIPKFYPQDFLSVVEGQRDNDMQRNLDRIFQWRVKEAVETSLECQPLKSKFSIGAFTTKNGRIGCSYFSISNILKEGGFFGSSIFYQFDVPKGASDRIESVTLGPDLDFSFYLSEFDVRQTPATIELKEMKTWDRYVMKIPSIRIDAALLPFNESDTKQCDCPSKWLRPVSRGSAILHWMCVFCGCQYLCSCSAGYLEQLCARPNFDNAQYAELSRRATYRTNICHLCRDLPSEIQYRSKMYGGPIYQMYFPYIAQEASLHNLDNREGENRVRERLGIPKIGEGWLSEMMLLRMVRVLFPQFEVEHQASPPWLGRQRFDWYIETHKIAIEYNGEQHYNPISHFGGAVGLLQTQQRDQKKMELSCRHGVEVVVFKYDEPLSEDIVFERVNKAVMRQVERGVPNERTSWPMEGS